MGGNLGKSRPGRNSPESSSNSESNSISFTDSQKAKFDEIADGVLHDSSAEKSRTPSRNSKTTPSPPKKKKTPSPPKDKNTPQRRTRRNSFAIGTEDKPGTSSGYRGSETSELDPPKTRKRGSFLGWSLRRMSSKKKHKKNNSKEDDA